MRMRLKELENEAELARERNPTPLSDRVTDAEAAWDSLLNYAGRRYSRLLQQTFDQ